MENIIAGLGMLAVAVIGVILFVFGIVVVKNFQAVGSVSQDRRTVFIQEFKEEKDGCIYYVNVYGSEGKTCGAYAVTRF